VFKNAEQTDLIADPPEWTFRWAGANHYFSEKSTLATRIYLTTRIRIRNRRELRDLFSPHEETRSSLVRKLYQLSNYTTAIFNRLTKQPRSRCWISWNMVRTGPLAIKRSATLVYAQCWGVWHFVGYSYVFLVIDVSLITRSADDNTVVNTPLSRSCPRTRRSANRLG
jgi:hypothetical protein